MLKLAARVTAIGELALSQQQVKASLRRQVLSQDSQSQWKRLESLLTLAQPQPQFDRGTVVSITASVSPKVCACAEVHLQGGRSRWKRPESLLSLAQQGCRQPDWHPAPA